MAAALREAAEDMEMRVPQEGTRPPIANHSVTLRVPQEGSRPPITAHCTHSVAGKMGTGSKKCKELPGVEAIAPPCTFAAGGVRSVAKVPTSPTSTNEKRHLQEDPWETSATSTSETSTNFNWKLLDLNLIIVGSGPAAEQLLERRLNAGGRACLLWTCLPPSFPREADWASWESWESEHDQVPFTELSFIWQPPSTRSSDCQEVRRLRRRFGSADYGFMRCGPDVVELADGECYELVLQDQKCAGVRVLREEVVSWQLSGAVLLVGPWRPGSGTKLPKLPIHVPGEAWLREVDVSVQQEEAKPQVYTDGGGLVHTALLTLYYALVTFGSFSLINMYEPTADPEQPHWWWMACRTMTWSGQFWSFQLTYELLGYHQRSRATAMMAAAGALAWTLWELPWMLLRPGGRLQYFIMTASGFEVSVCAQLVLSFCLERRETHRMDRLQDTRRQVLWTVFLFILNALLLAAQWTIIVIYSFLEERSNIAAGFFLSYSTSASELLAVSLLERMYVKLVWPRAGDEQFIVWGDKNSAITVLIGWAHAIAEGSRLISLLCAAVRSPSWKWQWLLSLLIMILNNWVVRHGYHLSAAIRVLPRRLHGWLKVGGCAFVHRHARLHCGYYRFIAVGCYMAWRLLWLGATPLFNTPTLVLFFVALFMEALEDAVVLYRLLPLDPWKSQMKHFYESLHVCHPRQTMCKDQQGIHVQHPPLRLHGVRQIEWFLSAGVLHVASSVILVLMWLPIGAGFNLGICPEPIPASARVTDAFLWAEPLRCS